MTGLTHPLDAATRAALVEAHPGLVIGEPIKTGAGVASRIVLPNGRGLSILREHDGGLEAMYGMPSIVTRKVTPEVVVVLVARTARKPPLLDPFVTSG